MWTFGAKYGAIAGLIACGGIIIGLVLAEPGSAGTSEIFGYTLMLLALSVTYFAIRRYRDTVLGGTIRFGQGFRLGLVISVVAALAYVVTWEIYSAVSGTDFIDTYTNELIAQMRAEGMEGAELNAEIQKMEKFKASYANPFFRIPVTFSEIFPVGLLVSLVSAALLRTRPPQK